MVSHEVKDTETIAITVNYRELEVLEMRLRRLNPQPGSVAAEWLRVATEAMFDHNMMANGWDKDDLSDDGTAEGDPDDES